MIRGEIWWADLGIPFGSEPGFRRPVLIIQANSFNRSKIDTAICVPFTTNLRLAEAPGNVYVDSTKTHLRKASIVVVSQISCIDRVRLVDQAGKLERDALSEVEAGIRLVLSL